MKPEKQAAEYRAKMLEIRDGFEKRIREARTSGDSVEVQRLRHELLTDLGELSQLRREVLSKPWLEKAERLEVDSPPYTDEDGELSEFWSQGALDGEFFLTARGLAELKQDVRTELRWKHEVQSHWKGWGAVITGLIGALIGLVSVLWS